MITGFQAITCLWVWILAVLVHGLFLRSWILTAPDAVRASGPIDAP
jgi:hypothetical protein